ncbi:unnamed protein product [Amoebophrya sp. A25]|nr:unnamed protein product [Amoebophrya sp. A25]|eukprot:GSA25T00023398001.1
MLVRDCVFLVCWLSIGTTRLFMFSDRRQPQGAKALLRGVSVLDSRQARSHLPAPLARVSAVLQNLLTRHREKLSRSCLGFQHLRAHGDGEGAARIILLSRASLGNTVATLLPEYAVSVGCNVSLSHFDAVSLSHTHFEPPLGRAGNLWERCNCSNAGGKICIAKEESAETCRALPSHLQVLAAAIPPKKAACMLQYTLLRGMNETDREEGKEKSGGANPNAEIGTMSKTMAKKWPWRMTGFWKKNAHALLRNTVWGRIASRADLLPSCVSNFVIGPPTASMLRHLDASVAPTTTGPGPERIFLIGIHTRFGDRGPWRDFVRRVSLDERVAEKMFPAYMSRLRMYRRQSLNFPAKFEEFMRQVEALFSALRSKAIRAALSERQLAPKVFLATDTSVVEAAFANVSRGYSLSSSSLQSAISMDLQWRILEPAVIGTDARRKFRKVVQEGEKKLAASWRLLTLSDVILTYGTASTMAWTVRTHGFQSSYDFSTLTDKKMIELILKRLHSA